MMINQACDILVGSRFVLALFYCESCPSAVCFHVYHTSIPVEGVDPNIWWERFLFKNCLLHNTGHVIIKERQINGVEAHVAQVIPGTVHRREFSLTELDHRKYIFQKRQFCEFSDGYKIEIKFVRKIKLILLV
jgi:hypothetical protein